jgi:hypothetical protein
LPWLSSIHTNASASLVTDHRFPRDGMLLAVLFLQPGAAERIARIVAVRGIASPAPARGSSSSAARE